MVASHVPTPPTPTPMRAPTMHSARIITPVCYLAKDGRHQAIPTGPCLIEKIDGPVVEVIWGTSGQHCTSLALDDVERAESRGDLVLLD